MCTGIVRNAKKTIVGFNLDILGMCYLRSADLSKYKDKMRPLIEKDIGRQNLNQVLSLPLEDAIEC